MTLLGFVGSGLALLGYLASMKRDLKSDIASARSESKADIGRIDSRLVALEARTYDISTRLPPAPASSSPHSQ